MRDRDLRAEVDPDRDGDADWTAALWRACSSAMRLSIAPLSRYIVVNQVQIHSQRIATNLEHIRDCYPSTFSALGILIRAQTVKAR